MGSDPVAADLDGSVLLVWADHGVTRMRLAPLAELADAANLEDLPRMDGPVLSRHLWVRRSVAIVAERTPIGMAAMRVDADGVRLLEVEQPD